MTSTKRFIQITLEYPTIFISQKEFSTKLGYKSSSTVNYWMNDNNLEERNINSANRVKICELFALTDDVWTVKVASMQEFRRRLKEWEIINGDEVTYEAITNIIFTSSSIFTKEENNMLKKLSNNKINLIEELNDKSPAFMFELVEELRKSNQVIKALEVLNMIENHTDTYKYTYHNQIQHKKAILLSHDSIQDWEGAIDILQRLYSSAKYHLQEPEIITLIASNSKRMALYNSETGNLLEKDKIDINTLVKSLTLYKEAYNIKDSQAKYYDAINFAYLHNIMDSIEVEYADPITIKNLYENLTTGPKRWKLNDSDDWWEVSSNVEFLMLLGETDLAISKINDFFDFKLDNITPFHIDATLRQLDLYIHFTEDKNAIKLHKHLKTSWSALQKN